VESLAVVIPFPAHRVRKPMTRKNQVFSAVLDEAQGKRESTRLLMACVGVAALLGVALQLVVG
jgi:hypothetical protein